MGTDGYLYCYVWRDALLEILDKLWCRLTSKQDGEKDG